MLAAAVLGLVLIGLGLAFAIGGVISFSHGAFAITCGVTAIVTGVIARKRLAQVG